MALAGPDLVLRYPRGICLMLEVILVQRTIVLDHRQTIVAMRPHHLSAQIVVNLTTFENYAPRPLN